ncbi:MAG: MBL fold metallo-hydrolase [Pseudomonadota bacterium]
MAELRVTILGCGSSGGVPRLGGKWGACDPSNPKNRRRRCALLVERITGEDITRVLIDSGPDMREQLLSAGVGVLDGVVYTHAHADHVHGLDDLRQVVFNRRERLPVWADAETSDALISRFGYAFVQPPNSPYPPILNLQGIEQNPFEVLGPGGPIEFQPFEVEHGQMHALGFRIGPVAYLPDVSDIPEEAWAHLGGLGTWILDALRYTPHPSHAHLERSLGWIERSAPRQAVLTNMHLDLDYATLAAETPDHVTPAHDGLTLSFDLP